MRITSVIAYGSGDATCIDRVTATMSRARPSERIVFDSRGRGARGASGVTEKACLKQTISCTLR